MNQLFKSHYDQYCKFHGFGYVLNYEFLVNLEKFIIHNNIKRILDLGSGFSSYFFRTLNIPELIVTVDDDPHWLIATKNFIDSNLRLEDSNRYFLSYYLTLEDFKKSTFTADFDLVLYDLGGFECRMDNFQLAYNKTSKFLFIDDLQVEQYHSKIISLLQDSDKLEIIGKNESPTHYQALITKA